MKRIVLIIPVLVLVVLFASCGSKTENKETVVRYVKSTEVLPSVFNSSSVYNGVVKESREVSLSFKVGGPVNKLLVDVGDYVKQDQLLAQIDKRDYLVQVQATEAQYTQAKGEYERYLELYERKKLPKNTLDRLKAGYLMAKSQYEAAVNALKDTELRAPFAGYVNNKLIENFETVSPGRPIVELLDFNGLEVVVNVPETHVTSIDETIKIACDIRNANQFDIPAKIKTVSKKSGKDRLFEVKVVLQGELSKNIKPGMVAKVKVFQESSKAGDDEVLVPVESVFAEGKQKYIWHINPTSMQVEKKPVAVVKVYGNGLLVVKSNIKPGAQIVTAGVHSLIESQEVKILSKKSETNIGGLL
ncbi:efflux RND transporter periplasmic adaptor subunit [Labilibacter sediminis]|nr:efflux RND transporter periplasmic adaptor subunit [Labilibacter sediminis]